MKPGEGRAYLELFGDDDEKELFRAHDFSSLEIGGFKAFGEGSGAIPIRPITIVFGPNSSGKSSLLHSLLYLNEVGRTNEIDIYKPWLAGGMIDLGGWLQCNNRHNWGSVMDFSMEFNRPGKAIGAVWKKDPTTFSIHLQLMLLDQIQSTADLAITCSYSIDGQEILSAFGSQKDQFTSEPDHLEESEWFIWKDIYDRINKAKSNFSYDSDNLSNCPVQLFYEDVLENLDWMGSTCLENICLDHGGKVNGLARRRMSDFTVSIAKRMRTFLSSMEYHGPFRDYRTRESLKLTTPLGARNLTNESPDDPMSTLLMSPEVRAKVNNWLNSCKALETKYEVVRRKYLRVDQVLDLFGRMIESRNDSQDNETFFELHRDESLKTADRYKLLDDPDLMQIAKTLAYMHCELRKSDSNPDPKYDWDLGRTLALDLLESTEILGYDQMVLVDKGAMRDVSFQDVGVGLSQVLPLVVSAFGSKNKLILMEQPELHIHPAMQAELADVFIDSAIGSNQNTLILETHSEHLLLRVLRRIRETTSGRTQDGMPALRPDEVSILYIEKSEQGAKVTSIPITSDGDFAVPWPKGFFPERAEELFGL